MTRARIMANCAIWALLFFAPPAGLAAPNRLTTEPGVVTPRRTSSVAVVSPTPVPSGARFVVGRNARLVGEPERLSATVTLIGVETGDPGLVLVDCMHGEFLIGRGLIECSTVAFELAVTSLAAIVGATEPEKTLLLQLSGRWEAIRVALLADRFDLVHGHRTSALQILGNLAGQMERHALLSTEAASLIDLIRLLLQGVPDDPTKRPDRVPPPGACIVDVTHIVFNHDRRSTVADAINIIMEAPGQEPRHIPITFMGPYRAEWYHKSANKAHEASRACYPIVAQGKNAFERALTVIARFESHTHRNETLQVRAMGGGVLGPLAIRAVRFREGVSVSDPGLSSGFVRFQLAQNTIDAVTIRNIEWTWQYRCPAELVDRAMPSSPSRHRIYITHEPPKPPWVEFDEVRVWLYPWTKVLEIACSNEEGAGGSMEPLGGAGVLTRRFYDKFGFQYNTVRGTSHHAGTIRESTREMTFRLASFIDVAVRGQKKDVGCHDMAAGLVTFGTALGIPFKHRFRQLFAFHNFIVPVGRAETNSVFHASPVYSGGRVTGVDVTDPRVRAQIDNHGYATLETRGGVTVYDPSYRFARLSSVSPGAIPGTYVLGVPEREQYLAVLIVDASTQAEARENRYKVSQPDEAQPPAVHLNLLIEGGPNK